MKQTDKIWKGTTEENEAWMPQKALVMRNYANLSNEILSEIKRLRFKKISFGSLDTTFHQVSIASKISKTVPVHSMNNF